MNRMEAVRRARDKLQAEVDAAAAQEAEKIKEVHVHGLLSTLRESVLLLLYLFIYLVVFGSCKLAYLYYSSPETTKLQ